MTVRGSASFSSQMARSDQPFGQKLHVVRPSGCGPAGDGTGDPIPVVRMFGQI